MNNSEIDSILDEKVSGYIPVEQLALADRVTIGLMFSDFERGLNNISRLSKLISLPLDKDCIYRLFKSFGLVDHLADEACELHHEYLLERLNKLDIHSPISEFEPMEDHEDWILRAILRKLYEINPDKVIFKGELVNKANTLKYHLNAITDFGDKVYRAKTHYLTKFKIYDITANFNYLTERRLSIGQTKLLKHMAIYPTLSTLTVKNNGKCLEFHLR